MNVDIAPLVECYGHFEQRVRQKTEQLCRDSCSACRRVCCRVHFCDETRESVFLTRVGRRFSPGSVFNPVRGWLSSTGCSLVAGRPPVCYEFLCNDIPEAVSGDLHRCHAMLAISMLLTHVGRRAIGGRHLVEATDESDLGRIHPERFIVRLEQAMAAFEAAVNILDGRPSVAGIQTLVPIVSPPLTDV